MRHNVMNSKMSNTPLYWREKIQSCHPAADVCWMTLLLEERASLNPETAGRQYRVGTKAEYSLLIKIIKSAHKFVQMNVPLQCTLSGKLYFTSCRG